MMGRTGPKLNVERTHIISFGMFFSYFKRSPAPSGIWTHDLSSSGSHGECSTAAHLSVCLVKKDLSSLFEKGFIRSDVYNHQMQKHGIFSPKSGPTVEVPRILETPAFTTHETDRSFVPFPHPVAFYFFLSLSSFSLLLSLIIILSSLSLSFLYTLFHFLTYLTFSVIYYYSLSLLLSRTVWCIFSPFLQLTELFHLIHFFVFLSYSLLIASHQIVFITPLFLFLSFFIQITFAQN